MEPAVNRPSFPQPAGFGIRAIAKILDSLVMFPVTLASTFAMVVVKSLPLTIGVRLAGLFYKPLTEAYLGGTVGKLICGIRVIDEAGNRLSVKAAYLRFAPWLVLWAFSVVFTVYVFSLPGFDAVNSLDGYSRLVAGDPLNLMNSALGLVLLVDCAAVLVTDRKRAVHDLIADSYCVWKTPASGEHRE